MKDDMLPIITKSAKLLTPMRHTDLSRNDSEWEYQDDPVFAQRFRRDISICIVIGFCMTIGLIAVVVNASAIDDFMTRIVKMIFL